MTKQEVIHFMEKIKAHYQSFSMESYVINEWYDKLKHYEINDVYKKLDDHLKGEYQNEIPKLHYITKYLQTPTEKKDSEIIKVRCERCGKTILLQEHDLHLARHNSVDYIKKNESNINRSFDKEKLLNATQVEFDRLYDKFIEELYEYTRDLDEKKRLKNIIYSKAGMPIEL